jgi:signal transduction histidine kinase
MALYATAMPDTAENRAQVRFESVLILAVAAGTAVGVWIELRWSFQLNPAPRYPPDAIAYVLVAIAVAALPWRRRHPGPVAAVVLAAVWTYHVLGYPGLAIAIVCFLVVFSIAEYGRRWRWPGCALVIGLTWLAATLPPYPVPLFSAALVGPVLGLLSTAFIGMAMRQRRLAAQDQVRQAEQTAQAQLGQRIAEERLRIARELHDVLAHTVSVISVQAGVALDALDDDVQTARAALHRVRAAAREAGPQLRAAVGPLRTSDVDELAVAPPAPGLAGLPDLLTPARAAGLEVILDLEPGPEPLSPAVELTAYRIVQESVTNVLRHAAAARVDVSVARDGDALLVEVRDDGRGPGQPVGAGLGLVGMRERAQLLDGRVEAGPAPGGGFRVWATLPLVPPERVGR